MTPIEQLTDEQLVKAVAVEVMGWEFKYATPSGFIRYYQDGDSVRNIGQGTHPDTWNPLTDANDRDMMVEKMIGRGYEWDASGDDDRVYFEFFLPDFTDRETRPADTPGRAVCIAALKAVRSENE
ncbi:MAG: hypothetical protein GY807_05380 [Gammaproteobacteria bacterium]|nr:hypothetical protein [Gammaproteobacteria bacterium]